MTKVRLLAATVALSVVSVGNDLLQPAPAIAQADSVQDLPSAVARYGQAWGSRDAARTAALHSEDSVFHLVIEGSTLATGREAIQALFAKILADNPTHSSTPRSIQFGGDFAVIEYDIHTAPSRPFTLGQWRYEPTSRAYELPAIDVIAFRDGLVSRKVTYLDTAVARAKSRRATRREAAR